MQVFMHFLLEKLLVTRNQDLEA